ncbi:MAG: hypothetical protein ACTTIC_04840 [Helicobacteraceae bacterium]
MQKENSVRLKYVRLLQRFNKSIYAWLKNTQNPTYTGFAAKVSEALKYLDLMEQKPQIFNKDLALLEKTVEKIKNLVVAPADADFEATKSLVLKELNYLDKQKNKKKYKRQKEQRSIDEF